MIKTPSSISIWFFNGVQGCPRGPQWGVSGYRKMFR